MFFGGFCSVDLGTLGLVPSNKFLVIANKSRTLLYMVDT